MKSDTPDRMTEAMNELNELLTSYRAAVRGGYLAHEVVLDPRDYAQPGYYELGPDERDIAEAGLKTLKALGHESKSPHGNTPASWWRLATRSPTVTVHRSTAIARGRTTWLPASRPTTSIWRSSMSGSVVNRVLGDGAGQSALARFDRDVLVHTGATHVIVLEGINDIGGLSRSGVTAADLIAGHRQLIRRARAHGLRAYGATLPPFEGTTISGYWTPEGQEIRQELNEWIRTSGEYDAVLDFDAATRDPERPTWFLPQHDCGDHLHPGDTGYEAMANAIDLNLF